MPIQGIQINAVGFDAVSILTLPSYAAWAAANSSGQPPGLDHDMDGVPNEVEYFMGQTGSSFTVTPLLINTNGILSWKWPYDQIARATFKFQLSEDLADWTTEVTLPDARVARFWHFIRIQLDWDCFNI